MYISYLAKMTNANAHAEDFRVRCNYRALLSLSALQNRMKPMMNSTTREPTARFSFCSFSPNTFSSIPVVIWLMKATSVVPRKAAPLPQIHNR